MLFNVLSQCCLSREMALQEKNGQQHDALLALFSTSDHMKDILRCLAHHEKATFKSVIYLCVLRLSCKSVCEELGSIEELIERDEEGFKFPHPSLLFRFNSVCHRLQL